MSKQKWIKDFVNAFDNETNESPMPSGENNKVMRMLKENTDLFDYRYAEEETDDYRGMSYTALGIFASIAEGLDSEGVNTEIEVITDTVIHNGELIHDKAIITIESGIITNIEQINNIEELNYI